MTITPQVILRAQAEVFPVAPATPGSYVAGFNLAAEAGAADVMWTGRVTLPAGSAVKFNLNDAAYTKAGSPTVEGALLTQEDLDGVTISGTQSKLDGVYTFAVRVTSGSGYEAVNGYGVYLGQYTGAVADWEPDGGSAFEWHLGPGNGVVINATTQNGTTMHEDWGLYNPASTEAVTVEVAVQGAR